LAQVIRPPAAAPAMVSPIQCGPNQTRLAIVSGSMSSQGAEVVPLAVRYSAVEATADCALSPDGKEKLCSRLRSWWRHSAHCRQVLR
jgi:hypothetical protein